MFGSCATSLSVLVVIGLVDMEEEKKNQKKRKKNQARKRRKSPRHDALGIGEAGL